MKVALIGNPNSGKTTLFNLLTGAKQRVGNWPGVTVERKSGILTIENQQYEIIDLPGTYSIETDPQRVSQDELIAREFVLTNQDSVIVNIIDVTNLQRSLYLTMQLIDLQVPMLVVLNMTDALKAMGESINIEKLSDLLGCPVVAISSKRKTGIDLLHSLIKKMVNTRQVAKPTIDTLGDEQHSIINRFISQLPDKSIVHQFNRWQLIDALLDSAHYALNDHENEKIENCRHSLSAWCDNQIDVALASARYETIDWLCKSVIDKPRELSISFTEKLDKWVLGRLSGIPFFLFAMYAMFFVAINFGSVFIDFFEGVFTTIFVGGVSYLLHSINAPLWLNVLLADGIGTGITTVSTFVPVIAAMFFVLSFLEDSGYLARAAMIVDRAMRAIGLPGKAFVPMLVGFGCGVPAIMGTRTLESTRDRIMSICMIPFMSCGARLPVYTLFAVIFFPHYASTVVFILYLLGIVVAIITGFILKITLLKGELTPFIMEMPVYRIPTLSSMLKLTWQRLKGFMVRAGKAIVIMVTVLSVLNSWGTDNAFGHQNSDNSVLSLIGKKVTPVFEPMGIDKQNWPATVGIFTGVFAKEAVIATLNSLYSMDSEDSDVDQYDFVGGIKSAVATIPENLSHLSDALVDPLGLTTVDQDLDSIENNLDVNLQTVSKIKLSFVSATSAMAYLIFILLYTPCAAALGAVYREAGSKWMLFVASCTFIIGWLIATMFYQCTLLGQTNSAIYWLIGCGLFIGILLACLRKVGQLALFNHLALPKCPTAKDTGCCN